MGLKPDYQYFNLIKPLHPDLTFKLAAKINIFFYNNYLLVKKIKIFIFKYFLTLFFIKKHLQIYFSR